MKPEKGSGSNGDDVQRDALPSAANEDTIDGAGPPAGWDPFEVWRTRVRDERNRREREQGPPAET